jgi:hypothetical protein
MNDAGSVLAGLLVATALAGCFGYVEGPGEPGMVVAPVPEFGFWGGWGGREERGYARRGVVSRGHARAARPRR